ncbi:hypothetical protein Dda_7832 [Drechslerella dactyloides]|uniref:Pentatricopeptide repeat-containing protein n=1 Tax=Drechslerella dactyloides TaxID=74499 RepID=A0AAD6IR26_DREDA|nr:hypothetical protein Dda_7832 [Drechslerella dactyloides]
MLERIATRLNRRGFVLSNLRTVASPSSRKLHSTFWVHNGETLLLGQCPDGHDEGDSFHTAIVHSFRSMASIICEQIDCLHKLTKPRANSPNRHTPEAYSISGLGLDFLYPPNALALLQRLSVKQQPRKLYGRTAPTLPRSYSSFIGDSSKGLREARSRAGIPDDDEYEYARAVMDQGLVYRRRKGTYGKWEPPKGDSKTLQTSNPRAFDFSEESFDRAWDWYYRIPGAPMMPMMGLESNARRRRFLFGYLTHSNRPADTDRTIELLESLDPVEFRIVDYRYYVRACLSKDRVQPAFAVLSRLVETSIGNDYAGFEEFFAYCIQRGIWDYPLRCWEMLQADRVGEWNSGPRIDRIRPEFIVKKVDDFTSRYIAWVSKLLCKDSAARDFATWLYQGARTYSSEEQSKLDRQQMNAIVEVLEKQRWYSPQLADLQSSILMSAWEKRHDHVIQQYLDYREHKDANPPSMLLYQVLLATIETSDFQAMQNVFDDWFKFFKHPNSRAYKALLRTFSRRGDASICEELFEQHAARFNVDGDDYESIIRVYVQRGEMATAVEKLDSMSLYNLEPTVRCYSTLIKGFSWAGDMDSALEYLQVLLDKGFVPLRQTYGSLMYVCALRGDFENVERIFRAACTKFKPTPGMWNLIIWAHVNGGARSLAWKIINFVYQQGMGFPLTHMYNMLMSAHANRNDLKIVNKIFKEMEEREVPFDFFSYSIMMRALVQTQRKQDIRKARQMLDMLQSQNIEANNVPYFTLMQGYLRQRKYSDVFGIYKTMLEHKISPNFGVQSLLLLASIFEAQELAKFTGNVDLSNAEEISRIAIKNFSGYDPTSFEPNKAAIPPNIFTPLISAYIYKEDYDAVRRTYQRYLDASSESGANANKPGMNMLLKLLHSSMRERNWSSLREIWKIMFEEAQQAGRPLTQLSTNRNVVTVMKRVMCPGFDIMLKAAIDSVELLENGVDGITVQEIAGMMQAMISWGFDLDGGNWNSLIVLLAKSGDLEQAFSLSESQLVREEINPYHIGDQRRFGWVGWPKHAQHPHMQTLEVLAGQLNGLIQKTLTEDEDDEKIVKSRELIRRLKGYQVTWRLSNIKEFEDSTRMQNEVVHRKLIHFRDILKMRKPRSLVSHEYNVEPSEVPADKGLGEFHVEEPF